MRRSATPSDPSRPPGDRRPAAAPFLLYLCAFLMNSATGVIVVAQPLLAIALGASPLTLGLLGTVGAVVYTLAVPLAGRLSDTGPDAAPGGQAAARRRSLVLASALLIPVDLWILFVSGIRDVFVMAVAGCLCAAFFWPALQAWLSETVSRDRLPGRLGTFNLAWSLGIMIGPVIGGALYSVDFRAPWGYAVLSNGAILALLLAVRARPRRAASRENDPLPEKPAREPGVFLPLALRANFVCWFALANIQALYPKLAVARGFSPETIGLLLFLVGVAQSAAFVLLRAVPSWHYRFGPLVAAHLGAAAGLLLIALGGSIPALAVAFPLLGVALGVSYYSSIFYSLSAPGSRGTRSGVHEFIVGSGFLFGPAAGGVAAQYLGMRAPFLLCAVLLAATAVSEIWYSRRSRLSIAGQ